jgi:predicted TIM-barrel fold metal-dependent hydrolase
MAITCKLFDFDSHYYEAKDAFTRYAEPGLGSRGVQWATINGRERLVVGGQVNRYILNPTFDPVARPGALFSWYRGNPDALHLKDAFGDLEPIHPAYRERDARLAVMDDQGVGGALLFPTLGVGMEDALKQDPEAAAMVFRAFNSWLSDDWGFSYRDRLFAVPYISLLDPLQAAMELRRVLDLGAIAVNVRNAPVPVHGGHRSPFDPLYDGFWGLAAESGVVVATHAGVEGYDAVVNMWEPGAENSLFRSPLRGVISKGRAVADFYGAAVCQLIFERFPGLRLASVENGANWAPDLMYRLESAASRNPGYFAIDPVELFHEHVWVTPFWEDDVETIAKTLGVERLLLGSDWPHAEGVVRPMDFVTDALSWADDNTTEQIGRNNAVKLLGVDVP